MVARMYTLHMSVHTRDVVCSHCERTQCCLHCGPLSNYSEVIMWHPSHLRQWYIKRSHPTRDNHVQWIAVLYIT